MKNAKLRTVKLTLQADAMKELLEEATSLLQLDSDGRIPKEIRERLLNFLETPTEIFTINELSSLSRKLNAKSDKLNSIISEVNQKLKKLNLGIETWLKALPVELSDVENMDENWNPCDPWRSITYLGYCSVEDEWQLAVKESVLTQKRDNDGDEYEQVSDSTVKPLLSATRAVRTKSMDLIPQLLDLIKSSAEQTLKSIEKAEKAAARL